MEKGNGARPPLSGGQAHKVAEIMAELLGRCLARRMVEEVCHCSVTLSQLRGLNFIANHPDCTVGELGEGLAISFPSATRLAARLVRKDLVSRSEPTSDRRLVRLKLTPGGQQLVGHVREERDRRLAGVTSAMRPDDRHAMSSSIQEFLRCALTDEKTIHLVCLRCGIEHRDDCLVNQAHLRLMGRSIEVV